MTVLTEMESAKATSTAPNILPSFVASRLDFEGAREVIKKGWSVAEDNVTEKNYLTSSVVILSLHLLLEITPEAEDVAFVAPDFFSEENAVMNFFSRGGGSPRVVLFPRCHSAHWTLWSLDVQAWTLTHFDSLRTSGPSMASLRGFIASDYTRILKTARVTFPDLQRKKILQIRFEETPASHSQVDGYNCGVFVLSFAEQIMARGRIEKQNSFDVAVARRMVAAALNQ
ncbi:hypothetical protein QR680_004980 [Steinernema hermaphroditum]|uniref:Ubiquitin-like protease family profile domain-containing protein n=1 Tax=Steinernema hermaphroditum TaxID=289476 RepID=A0AA39HQF1_9BILA|nr:hypothetical protein QR680_004980 [Steinernema hermaphroditum]